ncbi:hypothetical protein NA57DRAFT_59578 [Rhizodiscina lignyota]|uniref:Uncharacterized protein n=1 Tax=Rhizodiscina lignyota TaxID=1504668 RepID=A0A9P4M792_9PEZI|nr:hypothetical protein NA57DRAFT_59578 [Rhizodiscina lignyota]
MTYKRLILGFSNLLRFVITIRTAGFDPSYRSPRPPGRPRTTGLNGSTPRASCNTGRTARKRGNPAIASLASDSMSSRTSPMTPTIDGHPDTLTGATSSLGAKFPSWESSDIFGFLDPRMGTNDTALMNDSLAMLQDPNAASEQSVLQDIYGSSRALGDGSGPTEATGLLEPSNTRIHSNATTLPDATMDTEPIMMPTDLVTDMSRLNEHVALQLSMFNGYEWKIPQLPYLPEGPCVHEPIGNPFAQFLLSICDFISLLERSKPPISSTACTSTRLSTSPSLPFGGSDQDEPLPPSSTVPPLRMVTSTATDLEALGTPLLLLSLSCYLQLMQLIDAMLRRVVVAFRELPDVVEFFEAMPEVDIAGLPSMKGHLYQSAFANGRASCRHYGTIDGASGRISPVRKASAFKRHVQQGRFFELAAYCHGKAAGGMYEVRECTCAFAEK